MIEISSNYKKGMFEASSQLNTIKERILRDVHGSLKLARRMGFPDTYKQLLLTNKGRTTKRQLKTIQAKYLSIGTDKKPLSFEFIYEQSWEKPIDAAADAWDRLIRRAPVKSGKYAENFRIMVGNRELTGRLTNHKFKEGDTIVIVNMVPYAATIEAGFYKRYYETQKLSQGIMYWVTQRLRRRYGNDISVRFRYYQGDKYQLPAIEIAPAGTFTTKDSRPGQKKRVRRGR